MHSNSMPLAGAGEREGMVALASPIVLEGLRGIGCPIQSSTGFPSQLALLCARHRPSTVLVHSDGRALEALLPALEQVRKQAPVARIIVMLPASPLHDLRQLLDDLRVEGVPFDTETAVLATLLGVGRAAPLLLTGREVEVLAQVALGRTNAAIGRHLGLAENTVKNYLRSVHRKLGARSRTEAVVIAASAGYPLVVTR